MKKERRMRIHLIAAAILFTACADASGQAYRWVDKDGKVHYTQEPPPPGAKSVQRKTFRHGPAETSSLPYATQVAAKNYPVTLHTAPDCGEPCDRARALLVKRSVPFREVSVLSQNEVDELKRLSGRSDIPLLVVGAQTQSGFQESMYHSLLDTAGYPSAGSSLPIETLRRVDPAAKAPDQTQQGVGVPQASDSTYK
jgi:glutaredoxin